MGKQLQLVIWGLFMLAIGAACWMFGFGVPAGVENDLVKAVAACTALALCLGGGCMLFCFDGKEAELGWCWHRLRLGDFPEDEVEKIGWQPIVEATLSRLGRQFSRSIQLRDETEKGKDGVKEDLAAFLKSVCFSNPEDLQKFREERKKKEDELQVLLGTCLWRKHEAEDNNRHYLRHWDLFKDMGMLPVNPATGLCWDDPNVFRLSLEPPAPPPLAEEATSSVA